MNAPDAFQAAGRSGRPIMGELLIDAHAHFGHGPDFPIIRPTAQVHFAGRACPSVPSPPSATNAPATST